ncbi:hypothetical protein S7711_02504 [Stachybotrys chartarum IBT 7711]|uniref:DUF7514 domain-containing protein n=1 Tax=Stachybotrys chartarum (strain CBS 109288 / IBT 7711) TaxID=1280523 RepID=A0A084B587_STACB|nr:hypothetical protein S7711_02504 [Stachybotrys chartarum IBT 7711]
MVLRDKVLSMPGIPTDTNTMGSPTGTSSALLGRQLEVLLNDMDTQQKARIFQDFIIKTYRERTNSSSRDGDSDTARDEANCLTPGTDTSYSPKSQSTRLYQASVEDEDTRQDLVEGGGVGEGNSRPVLPPSPENAVANQDPQGHSMSTSTTSFPSTPAFHVSSMRRDSNSWSTGSLTPPLSASSEMKAKASVHFSKRRPIILHHHSDQAAPKGSMPEEDKRFATMSAVDLRWGRLFDDHGEPTGRLGQVLRGLANFLIAEFAPTNSLVIPLDKLARFYSKYGVDSDHVVLQYLGQSMTKKEWKCIQGLYQDLDCEFHLVQDSPGATPRVPGLTAKGFERWMTVMIQASPDREAKRLSDVMAELPIDAEGSPYDSKPERLPKQLSRSLFPAQRHDKSWFLVTDSLEECRRGLDIREPFSSGSTPALEHAALQHVSTPLVRGSDPRNSYFDPRDDSVSVPRNSSRGNREHRRKSYDRGQIHLEPSSRRVSSSSIDRYEGAMKEPRPSSTDYLSRSPSSSRPKGSEAPAKGKRDSLRLNTSGYAANSSSARSPSSSFHQESKGDRRSREDEYRFLQGRDHRGSLEAKPRTSGDFHRKRGSLDSASHSMDGFGGMPYEEYARNTSKSSRTTGYV